MVKVHELFSSQRIFSHLEKWPKSIRQPHLCEAFPLRPPGSHCSHCVCCLLSVSALVHSVESISAFKYSVPSVGLMLLLASQVPACQPTSLPT